MKENVISRVLKYNGLHMASKRGNNVAAKSAGDQKERFLKAFEDYSDALFRHATFRLSDREKAIDVVQDTFTKAWTYVRDGHEIGNFKPFLYKVLNNLIIDEYRKRKEASLDAIFEIEGVDEGTFVDLVGDDVESLINTLDGKQAIESLDDLPDVYREVIILRYVDQLRPQEISDLIEETENVVSVRIHRGMAMLKTHIEKQEAEIQNKNKNE